MGHPLEVLAWLANLLAEQDRPLAQGQIVSLGSLVMPAWATPGDAIEIQIGNQPAVGATFA
jgi:2-keto-4-pentenoate hydratase